MKISKRTFLIQAIVAILALVSAIALGYVFQRDIKMRSAADENQERDVPIVKADSYSNSRISEICDSPNAKIQTKETVLTFDKPVAGEERKTVCPWGLGDNLSQRPSKLSSRYEQIATAQMPQKTVLCGLEFDVEQQPFYRQDYFILTMNSRVLVTDAEFLFQYLQEESVKLSESEKISSYIYDWSRILGMRTPKDRTEATRREYCIGRDITLANCLFGNGEIPKLELHSKLARWLGTKSMGPNLRFTLIVTGDKDPDDCSHTPVKMKVKAKFAEIPQ